MFFVFGTYNSTSKFLLSLCSYHLVGHQFQPAQLSGIVAQLPSGPDCNVCFAVLFLKGNCVEES